MSAKQVEAPPGGQLSRKHLSAALQAMLAAALFCALWIALGSQVIGAARRHDFLNLYTGASLALDGNYAGLHDPAVQFARERRIVPDLDALVPFVRPPFYAALLAPLALMPFGVAFAVWILFQGLLLIGCWAWAFRRWGPDALILGAMYLPTALGIAHGQDCVFMLVVMIAAYATAERGQVFASGAWLGLGLIKFHLFLLWPFSLAVQRRWRMLAGFTGMAFLETLISFVLGGRTGLARYAALLQNNQVPHLNPSPELMINVYGLARNLGRAPALVDCTLALLVLLALAMALRGASLWKLFAATPAACLLATPHVYGYDAGLLLAGIWLALFCSKEFPARAAATALAVPLPFMASLAGPPWAGLPALVLLVFLVTLAWEPIVLPRPALRWLD